MSPAPHPIFNLAENFQIVGKDALTIAAPFSLFAGIFENVTDSDSDCTGSLSVTSGNFLRFDSSAPELIRVFCTLGFHSLPASICPRF